VKAPPYAGGVPRDSRKKSTSIMTPIPDSEVRVSLGPLAAQIRRSSNFRFDWQWFRCEPDCRATEDYARLILAELAEDPACHRFLRESFVPLYDSAFEIDRIHEHCDVAVARDEFAGTLARAAADRLGAYSRDLSDSTEQERAEIARLFEMEGTYAAFQLLPGDFPGCDRCRNHESHVFTNWFYGVAWDWCFVVVWEDARLAWVGCLTDTD
jgi:hypothetical protein